MLDFLTPTRKSYSYSIRRTSVDREVGAGRRGGKVRFFELRLEEVKKKRFDGFVCGGELIVTRGFGAGAVTGEEVGIIQ